MRLKKVSSHRQTTRFPTLIIKRTTNSCILYVSRNGICLEKLGSFSERGKLRIVIIKYTRLILWLKKGIYLGQDLWDVLGLS
jgi:hypothetical protein